MALTLFLLNRFVARVSHRTGLLLALLPLVFTGKAFLTGGFYGPADLYYEHEPWKRIASAATMLPSRNPILSDIAFANLPWRSAVREALSNGRFPYWNRFVLGGSPLFAAAGDGFFHPGTWLGILLPVALSFLFSCTFSLFLALTSAYLFFQDHGLGSAPALLGAVGWGFSTYLLFWLGFAVGPTIASLPLLLLAMRRLARGPGAEAIGLAVTSVLLVLAGGHPEIFFQCAAVAAVYFVWELAGQPRGRRARALGCALAAAVSSLLLAAPLLLPLADALPRTAIYQARRVSARSGAERQSVAAAESERRLRPAFLPFAFGVYGKSPVQDWRQDGSGVPLAYSGALLFPFALAAFRARRSGRRGRILFLAFYLAGLGYGASAPLLLDATSAIPGFDVALNYRMVFLAPLGLAGLAAFGAEDLIHRGSARPVAIAAGITLALLVLLFFVSRDVFRRRGLAEDFVRESFAAETLPLIGLAAAAILGPFRGARIAVAGVFLLVAQRHVEMSGIYPTLPAETVPPPLTALGELPRNGAPYRIVAKDDVFRPNAATLYGVEDVRGYEPFVLSELAETEALWCRPQHASHNRVDDLSRPFLSFLNARFALAPPGDPTPAGWNDYSRRDEMAIFQNPRALERVFVPRRLRFEPDGKARLAQMAQAEEFAGLAWVSGPPAGREVDNGPAELSVTSVGPELLIRAKASTPTLLATSVPAWPGWIAETEGKLLPIVRVNHAFVGIWIAPGQHVVRLRYRPPTRDAAVAACLVGVALCIGIAWRKFPMWQVET